MRPLIIACSLILIGCGNHPDQPPTAESIRKLVDTSDDRICDLDLSGVDTAHEAPDSEWFEFLRPDQETPDPAPSEYGALLLRDYRRQAFHRLLHAAETGDPLAADPLYREYADLTKPPTSFEEHQRNVRAWDDAISELRTEDDQESANLNLKFCIINERGGAARAAALSYVIENADRWADPEVLAFVSNQSPRAGAFKREIMNQLAATGGLDELAAIEFALMRDRETTLLDGDPKTATAFWAARDKEIDIVLAHISEHRFESVSAKLKAMVKIDQALRHLFSAFDRNPDHFVDTDEWTQAKNSLGERVVRVDEFNTALLKQMLSGRDWFRDDLDGERAAFNAWLIVQHADMDRDFQKSVLPMIEAALENPGVSKRNYAYLHDRISVADGDPQLYATQGMCNDQGVWAPHPVFEPETIDQRRADMDLGPLSEYVARFDDICPKP